MQKTPYVFPIIGGRKVEHLVDNIEALDISLTTEQIKYLEGVIPFDLGFPHSMIVRLFSDEMNMCLNCLSYRVTERHIVPFPLLLARLTNGRFQKRFDLRIRTHLYSATLSRLVINSNSDFVTAH